MIFFSRFGNKKTLNRCQKSTERFILYFSSVFCTYLFDVEKKIVIDNTFHNLNYNLCKLSQSRQMCIFAIKCLDKGIQIIS